MQIGVDCNLAVGNQRIFVLDTDEIGRMALQFMLHDEYETHEIASLQAAVAKAQDWPPDLIILGGGAAKAFSKFEKFLKTSAPLVLAAMGNTAGIVGAARVGGNVAQTSHPPGRPRRQG